MDDSYQWVRNVLFSDETIQWRGKPEKLRLLESRDAYLIPFSLLWSGFAIYWEYIVFTMGAPLMFKIFGIPFVLLGLYMIIGRFLHKAFLLRRTSYVITDSRILRNQNGRIDNLQKRSLPEMQVTIYSDGSGTIRFRSDKLSVRRDAFFLDQSFTLCSVPQIHTILKLLEPTQ